MHVRFHTIQRSDRKINDDEPEQQFTEDRFDQLKIAHDKLSSKGKNVVSNRSLNKTFIPIWLKSINFVNIILVSSQTTSDRWFNFIEFAFWKHYTLKCSNFTLKNDLEKFIDNGIDKWANLLIHTELYYKSVYISMRT